jgi:hypothetical protein
MKRQNIYSLKGITEEEMYRPRCRTSSTSKNKHHELLQVIVNDDNLFRELKARMQQTKLSTNMGVIVALHSSILDNMAQELENK